MQKLIDLFGLDGLIPHGYCLSWSPVLLWLHVLSDLLITLAYYSIPLTLVYFIRRRKDAPYPWLFWMFAGFIIACGTTHLFSAITIWMPLYWLDGVFKALTAILSVAVAVMMLRITPHALSLPSSAQLQAEIQQRKVAEEALQVANAELQNTVTRMQLLLDSALDAVISMDHDGNVIGWNTQAERIFGYSSEQALGSKIADLIVPLSYREGHWQGVARFVATGVNTIIGTRLEIVAMRADASEFPIELTISALKQKDGYFFSAYIRDITERKRAEAELTRSNADLEQFAYAVSHDMRQPLRMVSSYLSLIEDALSGRLDGDTQQCLDFALNGAKRMDAMILSLLDYSRIGRVFESKVTLSSKAALDEALAFLSPEISACNADVKISGDWPELFACPDELTRLLQNLVGNALKYHQEGQPPQVEVHGAVRGAWLRVEVHDQGIGIEPEQIKRLFKVFSRLQAHSRFEGTGVGLALCRKIVEHHGGTIGVESAGEGLGSVFWFELPVSCA
ncbi:MAG: sensor histidine kinase [Methylobacter sp.]